jgi:hypothetical protein
MSRTLVCIASAFLLVIIVQVKVRSQAIPFDPSLWEIRSKESRIEDYMGRKSLYLKGGIATVKDSKFTDGVIEFDISFSEERGFMGAVWKLQDFENYEEFYLRPHQSGNPDANQYHAVFNDVAAWQLYYGEDYSSPEKYEFNQWLHIKIVVSGKQADIYIKDMEKPALFVDGLKREIREGRVGLSAGDFAPAHFSNFSFSEMKGLQLKGKPKKHETAVEGTVMSWQVSSPFAEKSLDNKYMLTKADEDKLTWKKLNSEETGVTNLARLQGLKDGNTVFAPLKVNSDSDLVKKLLFGFGDRVKVYFNERLIYGGSDVYRSRDYRFLGTIGLFDALYLPLKKGDNEVWLAVSEDFGGWGVKAAFENMTGIRLKE